MDTGMKDTKEVRVVTRDYVECMVGHDVSAHPNEDAILCHFRRYDAADLTLQCLSQCGARAPMKPPIDVHPNVAVAIPHWFHNSTHILKRHFVKRRFALRQLVEVNNP